MKRPKKSRAVAKGALLAAIMIPVVAHAQVVTFSLDGAEGEPPTISRTVDGVTLTLFNPSGRGTNFGGPNDDSISSAGEDELTGYQFRFDTPVEVTGYMVGTSASATFDLTGPNGDSLGNSLAGSGDQVINGTFLLEAQDTATLAANFPQPGEAELSSLTVTVVPEPGAWAAIAGAGSLLLVWARRRIFCRNAS